MDDRDDNLERLLRTAVGTLLLEGPHCVPIPLPHEMGIGLLVWLFLKDGDESITESLLYAAYDAIAPHARPYAVVDVVAAHKGAPGCGAVQIARALWKPSVWRFRWRRPAIYWCERFD